MSMRFSLNYPITVVVRAGESGVGVFSELRVG